MNIHEGCILIRLMMLHDENLRLHAFIFLTERPNSQNQVSTENRKMGFNYTKQCGNSTTW